MNTIALHLISKPGVEGCAPLICHNGQLADPFNKFARAMKAITSKRKKTDDDLIALYRLEWEGGLYYDPEIGPFFPGTNVHASIGEAAKLSKRGQDVKRGLLIKESKIKIQYKGPREPEEMWGNGDSPFVLRKPLTTPGGGTVVRCRPIFLEWQLAFTVIYDAEILDERDLLAFVATASTITGFGDGRPWYGKCQVEVPK